MASSQRVESDVFTQIKLVAFHRVFSAIIVQCRSEERRKGAVSRRRREKRLLNAPEPAGARLGWRILEK
tara:strand:- start:672 stop:878 length:207 start_codon:yes stop_codon:yes gene_type:complete